MTLYQPVFYVSSKQIIDILHLHMYFNFRRVCVFILGLDPVGHSGGVFDCSIVSGLKILLAVSGCYNCNDGVLSVLLLCQFEILVVVYLELAVCWRRYCTGNVYYDMDNHYVCAFFVTENTSTRLVEIMLCEYRCNSLELCQISTIVLDVRMILVLV